MHKATIEVNGSKVVLETDGADELSSVVSSLLSGNQVGGTKMKGSSYKEVSIGRRYPGKRGSHPSRGLANSSVTRATDGSAQSGYYWSDRDILLLASAAKDYFHSPRGFSKTAVKIIHTQGDNKRRAPNGIAIMGHRVHAFIHFGSTVGLVPSVRKLLERNGYTSRSASVSTSVESFRAERLIEEPRLA